jgi:hypothetical protein
MDIFNTEFLETLKNVAIIVGVLYAPLLLANGVMDAIIKFRQLTGRDK